MADEQDIRQLLQDVMVSQLSPEEACRDHPELVDLVKARWQRVRAFEQQLNVLFPGSSDPKRADKSRGGPDGDLPQFPGYEVQELLGHGGMGVVYKARQVNLDRAVAIKMLLAGDYASAPERRRLLREAQAVAALRHTNIVTVFDVGEVERRPYFTMELLDGDSLAKRLAGKPQSPQQSATLLATLADAMHSAHQAGVVHRDLKPGNVLFAADGTPKIADFGLARRFEADSSLTISGSRIGTPSYMAPEQARGQTDASGSAVDIYALGAVLYEMLTGRPPFRADNALETQRQVIEEEPAPPSRLNATVPRDLETICLKCLGKDPQRRYASAADLADDLRRYMEHKPIAARPASSLERLAKWSRRHPGAVAATVLLAVGLTSACGAAAWFVSARAATNQAVEQDLREAVESQRRSDWAAADRAIDRAALRFGQGGSADSQQQLEQARSDSALAARLLDIREHAVSAQVVVDGDKIETNFQQTCDAYAAAFREGGIIADGDAAETVALRIRQSNIADVLAMALDDWALVAGLREVNEHLRPILTLVHPDRSEWRARAFDPQTYADAELSRALLADAPVATESAAMLVRVGFAMVMRDRDVIPYLTQVQAAHPDDFWANETLASALFRAGRLADAARYEQAAVALRPSFAFAHYNLATLLAQLRETPAAVIQFQKTAELDPTLYAPHLYMGYYHMLRKEYPQSLAALLKANRLNPKNQSTLSYLGDVYRAMDQLDEALDTYRQALALQPAALHARDGYRMALIGKGLTQDAVADWRQTVQEHPDEHDAWNGFAEYCLYVDRPDEYEQVRAELLDRFDSSTHAATCERTGRACLLLPPASSEDLDRAAAMIDRANVIFAQDGSGLLSNGQFAKALAEYRAGRWEAALANINGGEGTALGPARQLLAAMAQFQLDRKPAARETLQAAVASFDWSERRATQDEARDVWISHILRREAEGLIAPESP